jgi:hypothetical protein
MHLEFVSQMDTNQFFDYYSKKTGSDDALDTLQRIITYWIGQA